MEACGIWHGLYDYLVQRCKVVKVANSLQTKLNLSGKKTDKLDSMRLADLLRMNGIAESYVPSKGARDYRSKVRHRQSMVNISVDLKNMIHAVLRRENITKPVGFQDIFTKKGIAWLRGLGISEIDGRLELITAANMQTKNAEQQFPPMSTKMK